jgi:hypothetical protein
MDINERIENWSRWAKVRPHYRVTQSLEGRYKSPQHWEPPSVSLPTDVNDALLVEKELVSLTFPHKARELIKYFHLTPFIPLHVACRKIKTKPHLIDDEYHKAKLMLENRLK